MPPGRAHPVPLQPVRRRRTRARWRQLSREALTCSHCGSNVRFRAMAYLVTREVLGRPMALPDLPLRKDDRRHRAVGRRGVREAARGQVRLREHVLSHRAAARHRGHRRSARRPLRLHHRERRVRARGAAGVARVRQRAPHAEAAAASSSSPCPFTLEGDTREHYPGPLRLVARRARRRSGRSPTARSDGRAADVHRPRLPRRTGLDARDAPVLARGARTRVRATPASRGCASPPSRTCRSASTGRSRGRCRWWRMPKDDRHPVTAPCASCASTASSSRTTRTNTKSAAAPRFRARDRRRRARGHQDARDGRRREEADGRADARRPRSVDQEPRAAPRRQVDRGVRSRRRGPPFGLPGRRHEPLRDEARDAGLHAAHDRDLPYLYVNGGKRGYLVGMTPVELARVLSRCSWTFRLAPLDLDADLAHAGERAELRHAHLHPWRAELGRARSARPSRRSARAAAAAHPSRTPCSALDHFRVVERVRDPAGLERQRPTARRARGRAGSSAADAAPSRRRRCAPRRAGRG